MQFSRIYSFFLFLVAFGLFAHAKPVDNGLAVREDSGDSIVARHYPANSCGCCQDLKDVLLDLQVKIKAIVWTDVHTACDEVVAALNAAATVIVKIDLKTSCLAADIDVIVAILIDIILVIIAGCEKFALLAILGLIGEIDLALSICLKACITLCPEITAKICLNVVLVAGLRLLGCTKTLGCLGL
jgi:hypothetical protein